MTGPRPSSTSGGKPRLVATDLDGTLLHSDGTVTERTRVVLTALDALGVPVVFTTGRPIRWMESLWADVGGHGLAICSNGGIVYDVAQREVRSSSAGAARHRAGARAGAA
ncbi:HAD family hydrolase [Nocardioides sp. B-3]|uniref:HAD family hydrolase n=1 Tax=Nocardioides sp. B-3 TaxID=2895565 RepID=UPI0021524043|nr:HAD-IIB family hydrolase [Nocardioides sp. B-3]UUZ60984.1 HAD-IIB family hydrolase [Nocardioides sp. B-3]